MIEKYVILAQMVRTYMLENWRETKYIVRSDNKKQIYYFSLEFLLGRMLRNNMMSLGIYEVVRDGFDSIGVDINDIEEIETDAGLGNGGLGRLAACFLAAMATGNYDATGFSLRYEYGLFKQKIEDGWQEVRDAQKDLRKLEKPKLYALDRDMISSVASLNQDAERMDSLGNVFPVIFRIILLRDSSAKWYFSARV